MQYLDMLAKLGVGNAHPGGFSATLKQLARHPLPPDSKILEVGCGTGRTACYLAAQNHDVTGIDIRHDMIAKANLRAAKEHVNVRFMQGDACSLPFPNDTFDVILVESVSIFAETPKALAEYYRVLRTGGKLFDREVVQMETMPGNMYEEITRFYQIAKLWDAKDWAAMVGNAGFKQAQIEGPYEFPQQMSEDLIDHPDQHQQIDTGSLLDPEIWKITNRYESIMNRYRDYVGFILVIGTKIHL